MNGTRITYFLMLAAFLVLWVCFDNWYFMYFLLIAAALPVLSLLLCVPFLIKHRIELSAPEFTVCRKRERLVVSAKGWLTSLVKMRIEVFDSMTGHTKHYSFGLFAEEGVSVELPTRDSTTLICRVCDSYICDYLGLFRFKLRQPELATVTVMPKPLEPEHRPELNKLQNAAMRPSSGVSESYELRDYRPGDSMRDIHWKLTAKTDRLIVREPQEPAVDKIAVTVTLTNDRKNNNRVLANLRWVSEWLQNRQLPHDIRWLMDSEVMTSGTVTDERSMKRAVRTLTLCGAGKAERSITEQPMNDVATIIHIE